MSDREIVKIEWIEHSRFSAYVYLPPGETFETFDQNKYDLSNALAEINTDGNFEGTERDDIQVYNQVPPHYHRPPYSGQVDEIDWELFEQ